MAIAFPGITNDLAIAQVSTKLLATNSDMEDSGVTMGDDISCLGFPGGLPSNIIGFPILRSGKIASYPIIPAEKFPDLLVDLEIYEGNSGGPVLYMGNQRVKNGSVDSRGFQFIIGMITHQLNSGILKQDIKVASVIPAHFIHKFIEEQLTIRGIK